MLAAGHMGPGWCGVHPVASMARVVHALRSHSVAAHALGAEARQHVSVSLARVGCVRGTHSGNPGDAALCSTREALSMIRPTPPITDPKMVSEIAHEIEFG